MKTITNTELKKTFLISVGIAVFMNSFFIAAQWWATSPYGSQGVLWFSMLLVFPLILSVALIPISLILCLFPRIRRHFIIIGLSCAVYFLIGIVCMNIGGKTRMNAFYKLSLRSATLIEAIKAFELKHGIPPSSLDALVPSFLPNIPNTGMAAYPKYEYLVGTEAQKWENNTWILYIETPSGGLNWDMFMYFPRENYPQKGFGGVIEKVGGWAYVHE